jgi:hypothetical protein
LNEKTQPDSLYFASIDVHPETVWVLFRDKPGELSQIPAGVTAADLPLGGQWRSMNDARVLVFRVAPEQHPFALQNMVCGASRPPRWTNIFVSDPAKSLLDVAPDDYFSRVSRWELKYLLLADQKRNIGSLYELPNPQCRTRCITYGVSCSRSG